MQYFQNACSLYCTCINPTLYVCIIRISYYSNHRNLTFYSEKYVIKCEKIFPSLYKETHCVSLYREGNIFSHFIIYFRYRISDSCDSNTGIHRVGLVIHCRHTLCPILSSPGSVFTNHSQEHSLSLSPRFANLNVTQLLIG